MQKLDGAGQRGIKEQNTNFRVDLIQCSQSIVCSLRMPHKGNKRNYKKFWWLNDVKQLDWCSWEASISSENNSEPLDFDQVKAVTPMLAGFNWHKRYNKKRIRNKKLSSSIWINAVIDCLQSKMATKRKPQEILLTNWHLPYDWCSREEKNHMTKKNMKLWSQPKTT